MLDQLCWTSAAGRRNRCLSPACPAAMFGTAMCTACMQAIIRSRASSPLQASRHALCDRDKLLGCLDWAHGSSVLTAHSKSEAHRRPMLGRAWLAWQRRACRAPRAATHWPGPAVPSSPRGNGRRRPSTQGPDMAVLLLLGPRNLVTPGACWSIPGCLHPCCTCRVSQLAPPCFTDSSPLQRDPAPAR